MKNVTKIVILFLFATLTLSSCTRKQLTPDIPDEKVPIGFSAQSQNAMVKSETETGIPLSVDFGVWGIARHSDIDQTYMLWYDDGFMHAKKNQSTGYYESDEAAYWVGGYTYNFIAYAPFNDGEDSGLIEFQYIPKSEASEDALKFVYDMSKKAYDYDLLGAVAETSVTVGTTPESQRLIFLHLLSKINIRILFDGAKDAAGMPTDIVNVSDMSLKNVNTKATYTLSGRNSLNVKCEAEDETTAINFNGSSGVVNILPQNVSDVVLELDFTVGEGVNAISTTNYQVDIGAVHELVGKSTDYKYNEQYNWIITINPKNMSFDVSVTEWKTGGSFDFDIQ